jgi:hypothetical protein
MVMHASKACASLFALTCLGFVPHAHAAGALDNFLNSATDSVLDATKNSLNNAMQGTPPAQAPESSRPQSRQQSAKQVATMAAPARSPGGALPCITNTPVDSQWTSLFNGCSAGVWVITSAPQRCFHAQIGARTQSRFLSQHQPVAVCRRTGHEFEATACQCPDGTAITADDAIGVTAVSPEASKNQDAADAANGLDRHGCPVRKDDPRWAQIPAGPPKNVCRKS